jgi:hypothetical protein
LSSGAARSGNHWGRVGNSRRRSDRPTEKGPAIRQGGRGYAIFCPQPRRHSRRRAATSSNSFSRDSPANGSIHEEVTISAGRARYGVFNSLVLFHQHEKQNRLDLIEPDLAASRKWNNGFTRVSFQMPRRQAVYPRTMSNAPGTCCSAGRRDNSASIRARPGIAATIDGITGSVSCWSDRRRRFLMLLASGMSPVCTIPTLSPSIAGPDPLLRQDW